MQKGKIKLLKKQIRRTGFINGIKIWVYICMQKRWGRKVYSIHHTKLGKKPFYLRSCSSDDYVAGSILKMNGGYDFLYEMIDTIIASENIIDGGANIGIFSRLINSINPNAKIVAVELEKTNCDILKKNVEGMNVEVLHGAIWNNNNSELRIKGYVEGREAGYAVDMDGNGSGIVIGYTIDMIMNMYDMDHIDIIKLDIEGAEIEVFDDSCERWIDKTKIVIVELHDRYRMGCSVAVYSRMQKHGFRCKIYDENVIFYKSKQDIGKLK